MFVTSNGGHRWIRVPLPSSEFDETEDMHISDVSDQMILVAGTEVCAYATLIGTPLSSNWRGQRLLLSNVQYKGSWCSCKQRFLLTELLLNHTQ